MKHIGIHFKSILNHSLEKAVLLMKLMGKFIYMGV
jgi:hypothetical protein